MKKEKTLTEINTAKSQQPEPADNNEFKVKVLLQKDDYDLVNTPIDYENEDQFGLGMLLMHGLIDDDFKITPAGEKAYISRVKKDIAIHEGRDPDEEV